MHPPMLNYSLDLSNEENDALVWRIGLDCHCAGASTASLGSMEKSHAAFAFNFYTRSRESMDDVLMQYRMHSKEQRTKALAEAFMNDILRRVHTDPVSEPA